MAHELDVWLFTDRIGIPLLIASNNEVACLIRLQFSADCWHGADLHYRIEITPV